MYHMAMVSLVILLRTESSLTLICIILVAGNLWQYSYRNVSYKLFILSSSTSEYIFSSVLTCY